MRTVDSFAGVCGVCGSYFSCVQLLCCVPSISLADFSHLSAMLIFIIIHCCHRHLSLLCPLLYLTLSFVRFGVWYATIQDPAADFGTVKCL